MNDAQRSRLTATRATLDAIDERLLSVLAERAKVVAELWAWKRSEGLPLTDPQREAEHVDQLVARAKGLGLDENATRAVLATIIGKQLSA
ncbi:MAG: chorismate mutase [Myxococcales bacterium]|nr:chorismate mutase [Myxococcales bacterium]MDP3501002.1 chorismate mutase [Myxococcales bacterium]